MHDIRYIVKSENPIQLIHTQQTMGTRIKYNRHDPIVSIKNLNRYYTKFELRETVTNLDSVSLYNMHIKYYIQRHANTNHKN